MTRRAYDPHASSFPNSIWERLLIPAKFHFALTRPGNKVAQTSAFPSATWERGNSRKVPALRLAVLLIIAGCSQADATIEPMDINALLFYFDSIHLTNGSLVIRRSNQDLALKVQIGETAAKVSPPESTFSIPPETSCFLFNHESHFKILPAFLDHGVRNMWLVEQTNRKGDVQVCTLRARRYYTGASPTWLRTLEMESVKVNENASLQDIETQCDVKTESQLRKSEDGK